MREFREHKSQRRLEKNLQKADEQRERQLDAGRLSLASGLGMLTITVSQRVNYAIMHDRRRQHDLFMAEAERVAELRKGQHQDIIIREQADPRMLDLDFSDPSVTDMVLIGHGTIDSLWTDNGKRAYYGWRDVSRAATHLKQGKVEQMMCGHLALNYCVPLGSFAVSKLSNLTAATGTMIPMPNGTPREHMFTPVFNDEQPLLGQITQLNAGQYPRITSMVKNSK